MSLALTILGFDSLIFHCTLMGLENSLYVKILKRTLERDNTLNAKVAKGTPNAYDVVRFYISVHCRKR